jgi:hypothetical protein
VATEVDVYRPPARLGPRYPLWAKLALTWGAMFVVYLLSISLLAQQPTAGVAVVLLVIGLAAAVVLTYAQLRLVPGQSFWLTPRPGGPGDPDDEGRLADPEERDARRRLRRGAITRREYDRILARRHFVHGEISREEYHETLRELGDDDPRHPSAASPSEGSR